jgi:hypothetical protein
MLSYLGFAIENIVFDKFKFTSCLIISSFYDTDLNLFLISFYPDGRVTAGTSPRSGKPQSSTIEGINCRALRRIRWEILSLRLNKILCPNLQSQNDDLIPLIVDDGACAFTVAVGAQKSCDKSFDKP